MDHSENTSIQSLTALPSTAKEDQGSGLRKTLKKIIDFISTYKLRFASAAGLALTGAGALATGNFLLGFLALSCSASIVYGIYKNTLSSSQNFKQAVRAVEDNIGAIDQQNTNNQKVVALVQQKLTVATSDVEAIAGSNEKIKDLAQSNPAILKEAEKQGEAIVNLRIDLGVVVDLTKKVEAGQATIEKLTVEASANLETVKQAAETEIMQTIALCALGGAAYHSMQNGGIDRNTLGLIVGIALAPALYKFLSGEGTAKPELLPKSKAKPLNDIDITLKRFRGVRVQAFSKRNGRGLVGIAADKYGRIGQPVIRGVQAKSASLPNRGFSKMTGQNVIHAAFSAED